MSKREVPAWKLELKRRQAEGPPRIITEKTVYHGCDCGESYCCCNSDYSGDWPQCHRCERLTKTYFDVYKTNGDYYVSCPHCYKRDVKQ